MVLYLVHICNSILLGGWRLMPLSCAHTSFNWLMYRKGDISCQPGLSHLSGSRFINHVWLHLGELPPFGWGLKHLWHRAKLSAASPNHIWKCYMSRRGFEGSTLERIDVHHLSLKFDEMKLSQDSFVPGMKRLLSVWKKKKMLRLERLGKDVEDMWTK